MKLYIFLVNTECITCQKLAMTNSRDVRRLPKCLKLPHRLDFDKNYTATILY